MKTNQHGLMYTNHKHELYNERSSNEAKQVAPATITPHEDRNIIFISAFIVWKYASNLDTEYYFTIG